MTDQLPPERRRLSDKTACPCGSTKSRVMPHPHQPVGIHQGFVRRRECNHCGCQYETVEEFVRVVKKPLDIAVGNQQMPHT